MELVSVVIPCFNAERWIAAAVRSALEQTWTLREVIVVDDGSSDGSLEIVRGFGETIQLLATDHRGGNAARNHGLHEARGEWVQFLDADDYLQPEKVAQQFEEADHGVAADVIYSPIWNEDLGAGTREPSPLDPALDLYARWFSWQLPQTGGALWRRSALETLGGWNEAQPCCQEHELYLRALEAGLRFVCAPSAHAVYRIWSEETVCRRDPCQVVRVRTVLFDRLEKWMKQRGLWTESHRRVAGRQCFEMARTLAKHDVDEARRYHAERRARGMIHLEGPAAPRAYQLAHRLLGFAAAEKLAALQRS